MAKFSNAKVGDRVYDVLMGEWGVLDSINECLNYPLNVNFGSYSFNYTLEGYRSTWHKYASLYWNEIKLPTDEEDKKPFDLVMFLKENLKRKEFANESRVCETDEENENYCIYYNHMYKNFEVVNDYYFESFGVPYFYEENIRKVAEELNDQKIKLDELKQAFKELGWL